MNKFEYVPVPVQTVVRVRDRQTEYTVKPPLRQPLTIVQRRADCGTLGFTKKRSNMTRLIYIILFGVQGDVAYECSVAFVDVYV